jgi:glycine cleavage system aminomethyltransferase T
MSAASYVGWMQQFIPYIHTNWREETLSWKESCYICAELSAFPQIAVKGPDAVKLVSDISVNSFKRFPVGAIKHMIHADEAGNVAFHGLAFRLAEDVVSTHADAFYIQYHAIKGKYEVTFERDAVAVFQIGGPRALEAIEQAAKKDIHDLKFMRFMYTEIAGRKVRITRMGMAWTLAYEVHCYSDEDAIEVYNALYEAGKPLGMVKLGINTYMSQHTENGYPQARLHFPGSSFQMQEYGRFVADRMGMSYEMLSMAPTPRGTYSSDIKDYCRNPYELGWGHMVKFDHDFIGREALEKIAPSHRKMVTLLWNHEDIMKVYASFYDKGEEPLADMDFPQEYTLMGPILDNYFQYKVLKDDKVVGVAMWRTYTIYYRESLSLCCIDPEFADIGTEVKILYGDAGKRTMEIRATVARYPYLDLPSNITYDVETIPHYKE